MSKILGIHAPTDGRNLLLNPEFWLFQRTDPSTPTARTNTQYGPDRWKMLMENTGVNISRSTSAPARARYALLMAKSTSTGRMGMIQILEASDSIALRGKTVTFQIAAQSPSSNVSQLRVALLSWSGTADSVTADPISSWAAAPTYAANFTQLAATEGTLTNAYSQLIVSATVPGSCNNLIAFVWTPNQEVSGDSVLIGTATMSLGATASLFARRIDESELALCQRYFEKSYDLSMVAGTSSFTGALNGAAISNGGGGAISGSLFAVHKRIAPTVTIYNPSSGAANSVYETSTAAAKTVSSRNVGESQFNIAAGGSVLTDNENYDFQFTAEAEL